MGGDARPLVELAGVTKSFGDNVVLEGVDLRVERGSATVIAGPSGSGKRTVLRCVNRLETPRRGRDLGRRRVGGPCQQGRQRRLRTDVGMVFQSFNLFPHLTALRT